MSKLTSSIYFILLCLVSFGAHANKLLEIENAWIPEAPPGASVMAGYMTITNKTNKNIDIIAVSSADFNSVEMHLSQEDDGIARMIPQKKLSIPASQKLILKPGSYHLMLMKPIKRLVEGQSSDIKLSLSNNESITITASVKKASSKAMAKCGAGKCGGGKCGGGKCGSGKCGGK